MENEAMRFLEWACADSNPFVWFKGKWIQARDNTISWTTEELYEAFKSMDEKAQDAINFAEWLHTGEPFIYKGNGNWGQVVRPDMLWSTKQLYKQFKEYEEAVLSGNKTNSIRG
jgi:hypothetical protein